MTTRPNEHEPTAETWTHPRSGEKLKRTCLGACRHGRLALKRCAQSGGLHLYWFSNNCGLCRETFDTALQHLMTEPVRLAEGLYWLCRLAPGDYRLEERSEGGQVLYRLEYQLKPSARWHVAVARKGSGMAKFR